MIKIRSKDVDKTANWDEIQTQLSLRELSEDQIPRLLFEAIQEIKNLQGKLQFLKGGMQKLLSSVDGTQ